MLVETANSTPRHKCITFFSFTRVSDSVNSLKFSTMWIKFHKSLQSLWCEGGVCPLDWVVPWLGCPLSYPIKKENQRQKLLHFLASYRLSASVCISGVVRGSSGRSWKMGKPELDKFPSHPLLVSVESILTAGGSIKMLFFFSCVKS